MKKLKFYLDTTILNFAYIDDDLYKKEITQKFINELSLLSEGIYISEEVINEVNLASEPRKTQLTELIRQINPFLIEIDEEIQKLADEYIKVGIIPEKYYSDAIHIACAVVNNIDAIISWNYQHIVKLKTRYMVEGLNKILGYKNIEICSPEEVIDNE